MYSNTIKTNIQKVAVSDAGCRVGEYHPKARLSDAQVDLIRDIWEEGFAGYATLAKHFGVSKSTIRDICRYERRNVAPTRWKRVSVSGAHGLR